MTAGFAAGITVTVQRRTADIVGDGAWVDDHTESGCAVNWLTGLKADRPADPIDDRRQTSVAAQEVYMPAGADILRTDRIKLPDGSIYRVREIPQAWDSPYSGWTPGIVVSVRGVF